MNDKLSPSDPNEEPHTCMAPTLRKSLTYDNENKTIFRVRTTCLTCGRIWYDSPQLAKEVLKNLMDKGKL